MYLSHYNLSAMPFQISTDPHFLYLSSDHKEALANLKYGLQAGNGYVVLIGAVGTGKTTLVNALVETLDENVYLAVINHPKMEPVEFLSFVARSFDPNVRLNSKADCLHFFKQFLQNAHAEDKNVLLIIDEAHRLSDDLLEEIRLLSNMEQTGTKLIQIFFVGQTELKRRLLSSPCRALRQRITLFYHLQPLSEEETGHYIRHRLTVAGAATAPFTPRAIHAIYRYSGGYPRRINRLCDRALLTGYVQARVTIGATTIHECAREINLIDPLQPAFRQYFRLRQTIWRWWDSPGMRQTRVDAVQALSTSWDRTRSAAGTVWQRTRTAAVHWTTQGRDAITAVARNGQKRQVALAALAAVLIVLAGWSLGVYWPDKGAMPQTAGAPDFTNDETSMLAAYTPKPPPSVSDRAAFAPRAATAAKKEAPTGETLRKANAFVTNGDYQTAILLLENDKDETLADRDLRDLYVSALIGQAGLIKSESPNMAGALLSRAIAVAPDNVDALVQLGNIYTQGGDYTRAVNAYTSALRHDERLPNALFNLGFIYANTGDYENAEAALQRVVDLKPPYVDKALFNLAVVQQKIGKPQACLASLEKAVAIRPDNVKARAYLQEIKASQEATQ